MIGATSAYLDFSMQSSPSADSLKSRRAGLLYGSFIAEALSLGVHWNYDPADIARKHGQVTDFMAPGPGSYHPHKLAGEQGHVGHQALRLMAFLHREQHWHAPMFLTDWAAMWPDYTDYVDKATKATLANLSAGATLANCGSTSDELAGPARIAPLVAFKAEADEEVLFSWIEWPDKDPRDRAMATIMSPENTDPRMDPAKNPIPFDGKRMIYGGFAPVVTLEK